MKKVEENKDHLPSTMSVDDFVDFLKNELGNYEDVTDNFAKSPVIKDLGQEARSYIKYKEVTYRCTAYIIGNQKYVTIRSL